MIKTRDIKVTLDQLILDPNNYRLFGEKESKFIEDDEAESFQADTIEKLDSQRLGGLKDSIRAHGFLEMERIVVRVLSTPKNKVLGDQDKKKKYLVVEGNRRTAALKSLRGEADASLKEKIENLNVILVEGTDDEIKIYSATLMGIRHVSGAKKWDGFQSAKLINDLYKEGNSFTKIGEILGITNREAGRRYRGFKAFQQMKNSSFKNKVEPRHYGLLLEFLSASKDGRKWLSWNDAKFIFENKERLNIVYNAITTDNNGYLQIKNPGDARKFVGLLSTRHSADIEQGIPIQELPDLEDLKDSGKLQRIKKFITFIDTNSFKTEEMEHLNDLLTSLEQKLEVSNG
ncbi:ParB/Srx family N-terminal domain-containing protein [Motilimonas cestriensis]|uniref:ParB/Srx family N-terminal domain-containing protein n=1 Tax=Motilimonas cestriensis TaxID=2742685 RepID=UPI003DA39D73